MKRKRCFQQAVGSGVAVRVAVLVGVTVEVTVLVGVCVTVAVFVGVEVALGLNVADGVDVLATLVAVDVLEGVEVGTTMDVRVAVGLAVAVVVEFSSASLYLPRPESGLWSAYWFALVFWWARTYLGQLQFWLALASVSDFSWPWAFSLAWSLRPQPLAGDVRCAGPGRRFRRRPRRGGAWR